MEKDNLFMNDGTQVPYELNCSSEQLRNCFFNPNWENSMDQNDPFESALSSMVSSPATSNAGVPPGRGGGENIALRELIGRLGSICNSGEISPQSYIGGNNSANTSCYSTPINSPPKLNLSMMDHQIRETMPIPGSNFPSHPSLTPFPTDPGFAERAARFSCFANNSLGALNGQLGLNEAEPPHRLVPKLDSGKLSRVSSNQSLKNSGSHMEFQDNSDKKFSKLSRSSTPENTELGDSRENSSVSEQITGGEIGNNSSQNDGNSRKRKAVPRGKPKEPSSSNSAKDANVASENNETSAKRSKSGEDNVNEKSTTKAKAEQNGTDKTAGDGKSSKDNNAMPPEPPKDYIHVRARRGQATDAHSLAERVRREKISERMKLLQDLVPGCNKVTGKAVMLDEIINYVQSLQRQVEFLSMKLATINPRMDFNVENLLSKDVIQSRGPLPHNLYPSDGSTIAAGGGGGGGGFPYQFPSQTGPMTSIPNGTEVPFSMNHMNAGMGRNPNIQLPPLDNFGESVSQVSTLWGDDLQTVVQMGFGQNQTQNFHGIMPTSQMKVEL